jgi:hypothetical protein
MLVLLGGFPGNLAGVGPGGADRSHRLRDGFGEKAGGAQGKEHREKAEDIFHGKAWEKPANAPK